MKAPSTQEEINYRESLSNKINAISSAQGLFTDIEDKPRRLRILKALLASLDYGDEINVEIDAEIAALEELAEEDASAADAEGGMEAEAGAASTSTDTSGEDSGDTDLGSLDTLESFGNNGSELLLEDAEVQDTASLLLTEDDLPSPAELDTNKDFSENI